MNYNRKTFLINAGAATTAMLFASLDTFAKPVSSMHEYAPLSLKIMAPYWGFAGSITQFCKKAKEDKYDGVELLWPNNITDQQELFKALKTFDLEVGFLCRGDEARPDEHLKTFKHVLFDAIDNHQQQPLYINCHTGRDFFSEADNQRIFDAAFEIEKQLKAPVYHETHRSRSLYSAPAALPFLSKNKNLRLTLDISHWCNVSESFLEDQQDTVDLALLRTDHIHSRVGHPEGPQVADPRAPEWKTAVDAHFAWWDKVVALKREKKEMLTMLTEFGPPSYMPTIPFTNKPVADQWDINVYMMNTWRKRYL